MDSARPLRELFDELANGTRDGRAVADELREAGHGDLPPALIGEAIVNYADTAAVEVAEHLAPFVTAATAGGEAPDAELGMDLLAGAAGPNIDDADLAAVAEEVPGSERLAERSEFDLSFGAGSGAAEATTPDDVAIDDWAGADAEPGTTTEATGDEPGRDEGFSDPFDLDSATSDVPADSDPAEG